MRKFLITATAVLLVLLAAVSISAAETKTRGPYEIVSLTGTVTTKDGAFYHHLHMSCGDEKGRVFGGHLNAAVVSATCEMVIRVIDGRVERVLDPDVGLNLFRFL